MRIAVFNTYDITPGSNGGEIRFQNLYRRISATDEVRVLSYDRAGKVPVQRLRLSPALNVVNTEISLSDKYKFVMAEEQLGLYPHDVMCINDYEFSPAFLHETEAALKWADIVVVSPFLSGLVFSRCRPQQLKVVEVHNIEGRAKAQYFAAGRQPALSERFVGATVRCERQAVEAADLILTVSENDANGLVADYQISRSKIHVVPNGVNVASYDAIPMEARRSFRTASGLADTDVGVFLGSAYGPNVDSYRLTRQWLDEAGFTGSVLVIGKIAEVFNATWPKVRFTEHWMGFVGDSVKRLMVSASDFALQIVTSGGGTNLKLFDYMAAGIPIIANIFGTRGVAEPDWFIPVDSTAEMHNVVAERVWSTEAALKAAQTAHRIASRDYNWTSIAERYRTLLA